MRLKVQLICSEDNSPVEAYITEAMDLLFAPESLLIAIRRSHKIPLKSSKFAGLSSQLAIVPACVEDYLQWLRLEREVASSYEFQVVKALVWVVKFLESVSTHQALKRRSRRRASRWEEAALKELRSLMSDIQARGKTVQGVANEAAKWIDWPEFLNCVKQLKAECTPISKSNQQRSKNAIATSIQRYLIFAFFSCVPVRPRTVRELELGRTLVKRDDWQLAMNNAILSWSF